MTKDLDKERIAVESRRRLAAQLVHYPLRMLGYLEFSEIYSFDLQRLPPVRQTPPYQFDRATADDVEQICRELVRDEPPVVIRNLWAGGHHCFVARDQGRVIGYNWLALTDVQEEEYRIELKPEHVFCLNAYTAPDHRGRGVHYVLLRNMLEFAAQAGRSRAYTLVSLFNRDSWKSHIRMGWDREFTYGYFRPNFIPGRIPWPLTPPRYPAQLDWSRHAWFAAEETARRPR